VSDGGFDFRKRPADRRQPKAFEPPPWEADAFEELRRRKSEEDEARAASAAAEPARADAGPARPAAAGPAPGAGPAPVEAVPEPDAQAGAAEAAQEAATGGQLDERQVLEMMAELAAEEPDVRRTAGNVAIASAMLLIALGGVLIVWGMAAFAGSRSTGTVGTFGGTALFMFGAGFIAAAIWLLVRTLRQRGVL
jgi:hypothetical protein